MVLDELRHVLGHGIVVMYLVVRRLPVVSQVLYMKC